MNTAVDLRPNISVQGQRTADNTQKEDMDDDVPQQNSKKFMPQVNYKYVFIGVVIVIVILVIIFLVYKYRNKNSNPLNSNMKGVTSLQEDLQKDPLDHGKEEIKQYGNTSEDAFLNATNDDVYVDEQMTNKDFVNTPMQENKPKQKQVDTYDPITKKYTPHPTKVGDNEIINIDIESDNESQASTSHTSVSHTSMSQVTGSQVNTSHQKQSGSLDLINIPQGVRSEAMASTNKSGQLLNRDNITPQELKEITKIYNGKKFSKFIGGKTVSNLLKNVAVN